MAEKLFEGSPAKHGFFMPAEWERHHCTWLSWPHNKQTWPENLELAQFEFAHLVARIALDEPVVVLVPSGDQEKQFYDIFKSAVELESVEARLQTQLVPTNDAWARDYGPTFVTGSGQWLAIDWQYNAWGGKYPPFDDDQKVVERCLAGLPSPDRPIRRTSRLCIEGGALEMDDQRVLMCTRSCALDRNRNPDWSLEQVSAELKQCLGAEEIVWLSGDAIEGDDTDGHIDQLARFVPQQKIVYAATDREDCQYESLVAIRDELKQSLAQAGLGYQLIPLPLPPPIFYGDLRLPASYCNFYITNDSVLVPQFGVPPSDQQAVSILGNLFPGREVVGLPSYNLSVGLGSFHCLTQQQPAII